MHLINAKHCAAALSTAPWCTFESFHDKLHLSFVRTAKHAYQVVTPAPAPQACKTTTKHRLQCLTVVDGSTVIYHCLFLVNCSWRHRGHMTPEQAVQQYTGQHWRVPASLLSRMSHFAKYAIAVYGLEPHSHKESRFTNALMAWLRKSQEQVKKGGRNGCVLSSVWLPCHEAPFSYRRLPPHLTLPE